ncbi:expressed protein [Dictyostelium purpureum]|uniref:Expressed protein n=1 Tax=Dictyostelium purpureum TaxID=5786 RepID=F0ZQE5_DICPU|nr:uncharacterized protein DICPUDRAFT_92343 [Dictyostelium purpureum]EGC33839.1 expressed protein [Dictyostelium purpureum]|eukprot:XP_003289629.1 expressed protein [Dictyostelium purpureum]
METEDDDEDGDPDFRSRNYHENWEYHLSSFLMTCQNVEEIKVILDLKIENFSYQKVFETAVDEDNFLVFKFIMDNYKNFREQDLYLEPLDLYSIFESQLYFLKYAVENHPDQVELFFSHYCPEPDHFHWFTDFKIAELLMKHFPKYFFINLSVCVKLVQYRNFNVFRYYHQKGYLNNVDFNDDFFSLVKYSKDFKNFEFC